MRKAFLETLCSLAEKDERIWLLCGDLGFSVLEPFIENFPDRFINAGVAEQNMAGVATGLAMSGKIVFIYSIANFPVMRCFEQIRNDICYHKANVKIVTVGGGFAYGSAGYTHHGVEDMGVMRLLPNMTVIAPADPVETKLATRSLIEHEGPCYLRLGKAQESVVHKTTPHFRLGKAILIQEGCDVTIVSTGAVLKMVIDAAEELLQQNCSVQVISMHTLHPLDSETILQSAQKTGRIVTVEEHSLGGLGTAVAEVLAGIKCKFVPLRLKQSPAVTAGNQEALRTLGGLSITRIIDTVNEVTA